MTAGDEELILLALWYRGRVRRIHLQMSVSNLPKLIVALDDQFPIHRTVYQTRNELDASQDFASTTSASPRLKGCLPNRISVVFDFSGPCRSLRSN